MSTPLDEKENPLYGAPPGPSHSIPVQPGQSNYNNNATERSSDEDGTVVGDGSYRREPSLIGRQRSSSNRQNLHITTDYPNDGDISSQNELKSPSQNREEAYRLDDDLKMLQVERQVSQQIEESKEREASRVRSVNRERSRNIEPVDDFDVATNPLHERAAVYSPPEHPENNFAKFFKKVHNSSWIVRYIVYITPLTLVILIPLLIGALVPPVKQQQPNVGGVTLYWFCIWLEIVWLSLWAGRLAAKALPWPFGMVCSLITNNSKKWRDMAKQLEFPATLFFWMLAVEVSFLPIMRNKLVPNADTADNDRWTKTMNKVIISFFVLAILNFVAKIIIQLIAISFHLRTYQDRIEINKFQIGSLTKLYSFSKLKIAMEDSEFEMPSGNEPSSGQRTPGQYLEKAQKGTKEAFNKFGDVAGKIAGDFTGKAVRDSGHPAQVVLTLLSTTGGSQVLARRLYRTFAREETDTVHQEDLTNAFENKDESEAAFSMFDKDMNGDISMEELEAVCVEIGRERKSITASLKDLDSVVNKLDNVFMFIIAVIFILVLISLISTAASGVLTSAGSAVLALSWLFSATAQEFLQSIIFVFVKHPFDVGDRVTIYGNTGTTLTGDDYFVKEIALLYTEFKKMEGHVVQAPNSYLNTLFILNQRRSGGLAEAIPMVFKYGTSLDQIEGLRSKLLEFVKAEKREYQGNILTELREITEAHSITLNIIFFFKSNWQNELLRLQRRNKFICAIMVSMQELGIEGPYMRFPGMRETFPMYMSQMPYNAANSGHNGNPDFPMGIPKDPNANDDASLRSFGEARAPSVPGRSRPRGESLAQMGRRVDFSLGMKNIAPGDLIDDVTEDRRRMKVPQTVVTSASPRGSNSRERTGSIAARATGSTFSPAGIIRRGTDPEGRGSLHRNRFFGRRSHETDAEAGMAGIPEEGSRIDPRSGTISPSAVRSRDDDIPPPVTRPRGISQPQPHYGAHLGDRPLHLPDFPRHDLATDKSK